MLGTHTILLFHPIGLPTIWIFTHYSRYSPWLGYVHSFECLAGCPFFPEGGTQLTSTLLYASQRELGNKEHRACREGWLMTESDSIDLLQMASLDMDVDINDAIMISGHNYSMQITWLFPNNVWVPNKGMCKSQTAKIQAKIMVIVYWMHFWVCQRVFSTTSVSCLTEQALAVWACCWSWLIFWDTAPVLVQSLA